MGKFYKSAYISAINDSNQTIFFPLIPVTRRSLQLNFTSIGLVFELNEHYYLILFILLLVCVIIYLGNNTIEKYLQHYLQDTTNNTQYSRNG